MSAAPGTGKTEFLFNLAVRAIAKKPYMALYDGVPNMPRVARGTQARVFFCTAEEEGRDFTRRFRAARDYLSDEDFDKVRKNLIVVENFDGTMIGDGETDLFTQALMIGLSAAGIDPEKEKLGDSDIIILDSLSAMFGGKSMNDNAEAALAFTNVLALLKLLGTPTVIIITHKPKGENNFEANNPAAAAIGATAFTARAHGLSSLDFPRIEDGEDRADYKARKNVQRILVANKARGTKNPNRNIYLLYDSDEDGLLWVDDIDPTEIYAQRADRAQERKDGRIEKVKSVTSDSWMKIDDIAHALKVSRNSARSYIQEATECGVMSERKIGRAHEYTSNPMLKVKEIANA